MFEQFRRRSLPDDDVTAANNVIEIRIDKVQFVTPHGALLGVTVGHFDLTFFVRLWLPSS